MVSEKPPVPLLHFYYINDIINNEGLNNDNEKFIETEILLNIAFLEAECEIFSISKESIIISAKEILKDKDKIITKSLNEKFDNKKTNYLTLIRKK